MERKDYNGWTNYETWLVALWIDNDEGTQREAVQRTRRAYRASRDGGLRSTFTPKSLTDDDLARHKLADDLKEWVESDMLPASEGASLQADLLGAALSEVDFDSIARHYLDDLNSYATVPDDEDAEA